MTAVLSSRRLGKRGLLTVLANPMGSLASKYVNLYGSWHGLCHDMGALCAGSLLMAFLMEMRTLECMKKVKLIALDYAGREYDSNVIRVRIPRVEFDKYFKQYVRSYDGRAGAQIAISNTEFGQLNMYPRSLVGAQW